MRVAILHPDNPETVHVVEAPDEAEARLDWFHAQIGVEEIDFTTLGRWRDWPRVQIVTDDLFLSRDPLPPYNAVATLIYNPPGLSAYAHHPMRGVVILTAFDEEGETVPLPFARINDLADLGLTVVARP